MILEVMKEINQNTGRKVYKGRLVTDTVELLAPPFDTYVDYESMIKKDMKEYLKNKILEEIFGKNDIQKILTETLYKLNYDEREDLMNLIESLRKWEKR